jgi:hypothetical protein
VNLKAKQSKIHDIAGLLKMFFRDLPECLCSFELVDRFIATQSLYLDVPLVVSCRAVPCRVVPCRFVFALVLTVTTLV